MTNLRTTRARKKMTRLRARGMTLQAIANVFGLTRQAVHYALVGIRHARKMICCSACKQAIRYQENYLHNLPVLDDGKLRDAAGKLRLVYRTPDWEDFVHLAVTEIRQFGGQSIQVARRLRAMLEPASDSTREARRRAS